MKAALKVLGTPPAFEWDNQDLSDNENDNEDDGWLNMSYINNNNNNEEYIKMLTILLPHAMLQDSTMKGSVKQLKKKIKMGCLVKSIYAWSHFSVIWTLGGPRLISWLTIFLNCIWYISFQQTVSAEKTPTLTITLPLYKQLMQLYKLAAMKFPKLCPPIKAAAVKLNKYLKKPDYMYIHTHNEDVHVALQNS